MAFYAKWILIGVAMTGSGLILSAVITSLPGFPNTLLEYLGFVGVAIWTIASFTFFIFVPIGISVLNFLSGRPVFDRRVIDRIIAYIWRREK